MALGKCPWRRETIVLPSKPVSVDTQRFFIVLDNCRDTSAFRRHIVHIICISQTLFHSPGKFVTRGEAPTGGWAKPCLPPLLNIELNCSKQQVPV